jgi:hypothetical protein
VNGTRVGYARCSTDEQDVIIQTEQLLALGVPEERTYIDRGFSGTTRRNRAGLDQAPLHHPPHRPRPGNLQVERSHAEAGRHPPSKIILAANGCSWVPQPRSRGPLPATAPC